MKQSHGWALIILLCAIGTVTLPKLAHADTRLGASLDIVGEGSELDGKLLIGVAESDESFDYNPSPFAFRFWGTRPFWNGRMVVALAMRLSYAEQTLGNEDGFEFGHLFEPSFGMEYAFSWKKMRKKKIDFPWGFHAALPILIPGGDLSTQIDMLEPVGAIGGPRFGWLVGGNIGIRKRISKRMSLRSDIRLEGGQLFLFATRASINGTPYSKDWRSDILRFSWSLGMEMAL